MKNEEAAGTFGVVAEMLTAAPDICSNITADWSDSIIVSLLKRKGDFLDWNKYQGLKLIDHVLKFIERVAEKIIREAVNIDEMQFGF